MAKRGTFILGVGAQKSGTTWLHKYINSFENVNSGFRKEYHIFDAINIPECSRFRVSLLKSLTSKNKFKIRSMQSNEIEYYNYFSNILDADDIDISADITPSYSSLESDVFQSIFENFQKRNIECKIIYLMRDPFERCWSSVRMHRKAAGLKKHANNIKDEEQSLIEYFQTPGAHIRTCYDKTISKLEKTIPKENLFFGIYEELMTEKGMREISQFIGIEPKLEFSKFTFNVSPKKTTLSSKTMKMVVNEFKTVYEVCAEKFPQTKTLWVGNSVL